MIRNRRRMLCAAVIMTAAVLCAGCTPEAGPSDWSLEPIRWATALQDPPGSAGSNTAHPGETVDVAFGMHLLAADGDGGFWAVSGDAWLHVDAGGSTTARFNAEPDDPLSRVRGIAALSPAELVVTRDEGAPVLSILDTATMTLRDLPGEEPRGTGEAADLGDWIFGDVAVQSGDAIVVRYQPGSDASIDYQVLRVDLDDGSRTLLYSEPLPLPDEAQGGIGVPPVDVDAGRDGTIHLATPTARIVLDADGTERSRVAQNAERPHVAVGTSGSALWWGGSPTAQSDDHGVVIGGSSEARELVERRSASGDDLLCADSLTMTDSAGAQHPLPFLCGANAAVWTGDSWVVAIGGEGDGVLVRLVAPKNS